MKDEILAGIEKDNIKYLQAGQISKYIFPIKRKEAHDKKIAHLIVRVFIMAQKEGEVLYLVQKRSKNKKGYPNFFTDSASGHVTYEKNISLERIRENALRELEEEFGISSDDIQDFRCYRLGIEEDQFTPEIAYIFIGMVNPDVELKPDLEELELIESRFYKKSELEELLERKDAVDYSRRIWKELLGQRIESLFDKIKISESTLVKSDLVALFLGRFQPFHKGHLFVIKEAINRFKKLKIGIGSSQLSNELNDPFSITERRKFIQDTLQKLNIDQEKYEIYDIPDIFNAEKWVNHVISIVGNVDIIVSNSDWVRNLFKMKGYSLEKKIYEDMDEYNASKIRKLIISGDERWLDLVPETVINLIKQFKGTQRLKDLEKKRSSN